eukprot:m.248760 g.248760  ORF g.248760 m.248760 type:complete len:291 (-) comp54491_c0_seq1:3029-3901(-)
MNYIVYNDEPPTGDVGNPGHTKGVFAFNTLLTHGFWITHSIPKYPDDPIASYSGTKAGHVCLDCVLGDASITVRLLPAGIRPSEEIYAQSALCVSLTMSEMEQLAGLLLLNSPGIYAQNVSTAALGSFPNIAALSSKSFSKAPVCQNLTLGGLNVFAKSDEWQNELWDACLAPTYESGFMVMSWIRGDPYGPACPPSFNYTTLDITQVDYGFPGFAWAEDDDHGKWGVASALPVVCFGDINRMTTQANRGGGAVCMENYPLWLQLTNAISLTDNCTTPMLEQPSRWSSNL